MHANHAAVGVLGGRGRWRAGRLRHGFGDRVAVVRRGADWVGGRQCFLDPGLGVRQDLALMFTILGLRNQSGGRVENLQEAFL